MPDTLTLALCSDLHVDAWAAYGSPEATLSWPSADLLLCCGDIHDEQQGSASVLHRLGKQYPAVVWVDGNHEAVYHGRDVSRSAASCAALVLPPSVRFLGARATHRVGSVLFVGACGWWDFSYCQPEEEPEAARAHLRRVAVQDSWFDQEPASGTIDEAVAALAEADAAHVTRCVAEAQADDSVAAIVVLTHTVPHVALLQKGVYPKSLLEAAFYGSSHMAAVAAADAKHKVALWVYGHSHSGADQAIGHIHYVSHPRGRPDDFDRRAYSPLLIQLRSGPDGHSVTVLRDPPSQPPAE